MNSTETPVSPYKLEELANKFDTFKLSDEQITFYREMKIPRQFARMMSFVQLAKVDNEAIDYWMAFKPGRQEGESFPDYKARTKFQNALLKNRKYIYNHKPTQYL